MQHKEDQEKELEVVHSALEDKIKNILIKVIVLVKVNSWIGQ